MIFESNSSQVEDPNFDLEKGGVVEFYRRAEEIVISSGYQNEIEWQRHQTLDKISEAEFLKEGAWVILCSGFKESYIRRIFDQFSLCFLDWYSADEIAKRAEECRAAGLRVFGNKRKVDATVEMSRMVSAIGFEEVLNRIRMDPIAELEKFPMIGKITAWHLAKNIGCSVAKPDRHLVRLTEKFGFRDTHVLCSHIAEQVGECVSVIDIVLWRHATLDLRVS